MRILVLGINYWPEDTGIAVFNTGRCEFLAARGHDVTMCTGFPYYPYWRLASAYRGRIFAREALNGVSILRSYVYVPQRVSSVARVLHEASFIASATLRAIGSQRPDVLLTVSPPLGLAATAGLLSRAWGIPYVFHVPDLQPDAALDLGMLPAGRLTQLLYGVERLAYRNAALVSTLTEAMQDRIVAKGIAREKVVRFPDWADPAFFDVPRPGGAATFRKTYGIGDRFLVVHAGNMGVKQGLDVVLDAALLSRDRPEILYLLVGDGAVRRPLELRARRMGLTNVQFLPLQPRDVFLDMLAATDVGLVTQHEAVADVVFPSKVLTLFAAGRCVLASVRATSEVARVVRAAGAGGVVQPGNPRALVDAIVAVRADGATRRTMAKHARAHARAHWSRERILPAMEDALVGVAGGRCAGSRGQPAASDATGRVDVGLLTATRTPAVTTSTPTTTASAPNT
jgi:colanic acid biosynthesis glycosyl transferase WcaI